MRFFLDTQRLHLRPIESGDLNALVALDSDPLVMKYISGGKANTAVDYEKLLPRMMAYGDGPIGYFAAQLPAQDGRFVGWFHLRPSVVDSEILELGYRLERSVWGRGLATEGSVALVQHAFNALGQSFVDGCALPENTASIAVLRKCGMRSVGLFMHPRGNMECERFIVSKEDRIGCHTP